MSGHYGARHSQRVSGAANERVRLCQLDTLGNLAVLRASASGIQVAEDEDDEPASASSSVVRLCLVAGIW